jgi:5-methylcytosine-specific restriction protein A
MKLKDLTDPRAVEQAVREFDELERDAFLRKYGFGPARSYFLKVAERFYDSKAIAGAAIGYQFPDAGPLTSTDFSGGERTVADKFRQLGFEVVITEPSAWLGKGPADLRPGDQLSNADLGTVFKCGNNGGMRRSHATNTLVIVSDPTKGLYLDEWREGVLHYTGMGLRGPQTLEGNQNLTLARSRDNGVGVHLFEVHQEGVYTYGGQVELAADPYQAQQPDADGSIRSVWVFPVRRIDEAAVLPMPQTAVRKVAERQRKDAKKLTNDDITARAELRSRPASSRVTTATTYVRDEYVAEYARRRANGLCDLCRQPAPFADRNGQPHLESHHIVWLARGGDDSISNTVALCPNCHRKMHVLDLPADRRVLQQRALLKLEQAIEPQPSQLLAAACG